MICTILNDDGTEFNPPVNPLKEKWDKLYPSCNFGGYNCMYCRDCPKGDYWKVPEEDREIYEEYLKESYKYLKSHNDWCEKL